MLITDTIYVEKNVIKLHHFSEA